MTKNYKEDKATLKLAFSNDLTWSYELLSCSPAEILGSAVLFLRTLEHTDESIAHWLTSLAEEVRQEASVNE